MFLGSHEVGHRAAMLYSFLSTCKKQGVNPIEWLTYVIERLPYYTKNDSLKELMPQNWVKTQESTPKKDA